MFQHPVGTVVWFRIHNQPISVGRILSPTKIKCFRFGKEHFLNDKTIITAIDTQHDAGKLGFPFQRKSKAKSHNFAE